MASSKRLLLFVVIASRLFFYP